MDEAAISKEDFQALCGAAEVLEKPGLVGQLSNLVGQPIEKLFQKLPQGYAAKIAGLTGIAIEKSMDLALRTLSSDDPEQTANKMHQLLAGISGAVGGAFGLASLAVELPVSTTIMLRSIADIARSHGEDMTTVEARLACVEVFALGDEGGGKTGASEAGYYAVRAALAKMIGDAAKHITQKGLTAKGAPIIAQFIAKVAARYSIPVTQKAAVQAVPAIGAIGGATVNMLFMNHFQNLANAHFTMRRLERKYGTPLVQDAYEGLRQKLAGAKRQNLSK